MKPLHIVLAVFVAVIWGIAFVVSKIGLESFTPPQLTLLRDDGEDTHFVGANNGPLLQIPGTGVIWKICKQ